MNRPILHSECQDGLELGDPDHRCTIYCDCCECDGIEGPSKQECNCGCTCEDCHSEV